MIVRILPEAETDLESIGDYIARDNPRRAVTFIEELRAIANAIGETPYGFPVINRYERSGIRHRVHGKYQIFYRIASSQERIDVLRIVHGARNYPALLFA